MERKFDTEVAPRVFGYASGYTGPASLQEQLAELQRYYSQADFGSIGTFDQRVANVVPKSRGEGLFLFPRWQTIGKTYSEATKISLEVLGIVYGGRVDIDIDFYEELDEEHFRQFAPTAAALEEIGQKQDGKVLIAPGQFGAGLVGRSARGARERVLAPSFCLGLFEIINMLIANPNRMQAPDDLKIDCLGDQAHDPDRHDATFNQIPTLRIKKRKSGILMLVIRRQWHDITDGRFSAPTAQIL